jgi:hypothetical protein
MSMITQADPVDRLKALSAYMNRWIDEWPKPRYNFEDFVHKKFPQIIPGTIAHTKSLATHCFYCNRQFTADKSFIASVDHYLPQSEGQTERFVICCVDCNSRKSNIMPDVLVTKMTQATLKGREMWGYHGKKLKFIAGQIQKITNDMLYNMGPKIYYFKR